jgi:hypothetical protein
VSNLILSWKRDGDLVNTGVVVGRVDRRPGEDLVSKEVAAKRAHLVVGVAEIDDLVLERLNFVKVNLRA